MSNNQQVVQILNQVAGPEARRNTLAFVLGFLAGLVGLLGVGYVLNGKIGAGLLRIFVLSPVYFLAWLFFLTVTAFLGAILLPLHLVIVWQDAKRGAISV